MFSRSCDDRGGRALRQPRKGSEQEVGRSRSVSTFGVLVIHSERRQKFSKIIHYVKILFRHFVSTGVCKRWFRVVVFFSLEFLFCVLRKYFSIDSFIL